MYVCIFFAFIVVSYIFIILFIVDIPPLSASSLVVYAFITSDKNWIFYPYRLRAANKPQADGAKKTRTRDRAVRAMPAPEANAELQSNLDVRQYTASTITDAS